MGDRFGGGSHWSVHLGFGLVMLVAVSAFVRIAQSHWRGGATLLGGSLLLAALWRAVVPSRRAGLLAIRSRPVDVFLYLGLGLLVVAVAVTIKGGPLAGWP